MSATERTDEQLIAAIVAGNNQAFDELYHRHLYGVRQYVARQYYEASEDIDDVVQRAWTNVFQYADTYKPDSGKVFTWVLNIARQCVLAVLRDDNKRNEAHAGYRQELLDRNPDLIDQSTPAEEVAILKEERQRHTTVLQAAAMIGGPKDVEIIAALSEGLTFREVGKKVGVNFQRVGQIKKRVSKRARKLAQEIR